MVWLQGRSLDTWGACRGADGRMRAPERQARVAPCQPVPRTPVGWGFRFRPAAPGGPAVPPVDEGGAGLGALAGE